MWVVRSAACEAKQAVFFYYDRGRNGDINAELLKGFRGVLATDGYSGYGKMDGIRRALCWAHVRRYYIESIPLDSKGKELLTKALVYSTNQKEYLETFLEDGRLPISNNLCESAIRPFAAARRAWLFADTPKGAKASAVLYTLVESAKANDLDLFEYLKYLLMEMPNNRHPEHPEIIEKYLPWSAELPEKCRLKRKNKSAS